MVTEWLVRRFVAEPDRVSEPRVRKAYGVLEGVVSVGINLVVSLAKFIPGVLIGSVALIADAVHSLSDVASSVVVIWGFRAAARPSDKQHPFGHGRAESIASLVIAVLLLVAAFEFGKSSLVRLLDPRPVVASAGLVLALAATMLIKEWLARFSRHLGRTIGSTALEADFWHHRSDVLSTLVVLVGLVASTYGLAWMDGAAGVVVSGFLAFTGVRLIRESVHPLIGEAPSPGLLQEIRAVAMTVPGVRAVHDIIIHRYGSLLVTSLHIEVPADVDVMIAHEMAEDVEQAVMAHSKGWATVHVDPINRAHPLYSDVEGFLAQEVPRTEGATSFHDLRIVGRDAPCFVVFDLVTEDGVGDGPAQVLQAAVQGRFPAVAKVVVTVEPRFVY